MTESIEIGSTYDLKNANGDAVVRLVHVGGNMVQMHRQYRNILTNELSDWAPSRETGEAKPKMLTDAQITQWLTKVQQERV